MAKNGARVHIYGDWDGSGVKKAQQDISMFEKQAAGFSGSFNKSMLGVGAAIGGAFAVGSVISSVTGYLQDATTAALADEKAMTSLGQTLVNVGQGFRQTDVEAWIDQMQRATGVADDELRPALQQLVTSTGDVGEAQSALRLAMDIAAGSSKSVQEVSVALSAAYAGNFTAISRLKTGIDASIIASKDMGAITDALSSKFAGQATTAANTYQGKINRLTIAADEAKEAIGYALLRSVDNLTEAFGGAGGAAAAIDQTSNELVTLMDAYTGVQAALLKTVKRQDQTTESIDKTSGVVEFLVGRIPYLGHTFVTAMNNMQRESLQTASTAMSMAGAWDAASAAAYRLAGARYAAQVASQKEAAVASTWNAGYVTQANQANTLAKRMAALAAARKAAEAAANTDTDGGAGSASAAAAEKLVIVWRKAAADISTSLDSAEVKIKGKSVSIAGTMAAEFGTRSEAFKTIIADQVSTITTARKALDDYSKSVTDTIMGKVNFQTTGTDAEGKTVALTPDQIVAMVLGDIANQAAAVNAISQIATKIPEALAKQMLSMDPKAAIGLANYLADPVNSATVVKLNENYAALATLTETTLGVPMAAAWAVVGDKSALSMIAKAKETIAKESAAFRQWVRSHLHTEITVRVNYDTSGAPVGARANGGPVGAGMPYIVGERGPEMFVPSTAGYVVANDNLRSGSSGAGGNSYSITVQAGVGDPRQIGQQVVEYIKRFESANGNVFAAA